MNIQPARTVSRKQRELTLTVSVFLLGREELKNLFWNIMNVQYTTQNNTLSVGVSTVEGKLGTTLTKLRKTARDLAVYMYESGLTFRKSHVHFYIHTENGELAKIEHLLESLDAQLKN